jgi:hypothetical protein
MTMQMPCHAASSLLRVGGMCQCTGQAGAGLRAARAGMVSARGGNVTLPTGGQPLPRPNTALAVPSRPTVAALALLLALAGCSALSNPFAAAPPLTAVADLEQTRQVLQVIPSAAQTVPTLQGVGYAVVSAQNGKSLTHRRLMAIRVARLEAMRELTEKIHGLRLSASTSVADAIIQSDTLRSTVDGTIRGARTVRIEPKGSDTYEVILEIDREMIETLLRGARRGA